MSLIQIATNHWIDPDAVESICDKTEGCYPAPRPVTLIVMHSGEKIQLPGHLSRRIQDKIEQLKRKGE